MTNNRGQGNEPTSYDLRPPHAPQTPPPTPPRSAPPYPGTPVPPPAGMPLPPYSTTPPGASAPVPPQPAGLPMTGQAPLGEPGMGRRIGGRYRLVGKLGHGGMGTVWRAHDEVVDREVAVKEPRVPDHVNAGEREKVYLRMQREARAAARIEHPAVVTMHDVVIEDGKPWIVMELVHGQSLAARLQEGTLDVREAARIGLAVLGALAAAHEAGVLHRDVKPDNVLLGRGERVVLTDFGIAQVEGEQGLTETGAFVGSPEFIAPERVLGQRPGPESDLWSLGVVLYAAVEGMSPYRRSHIPATLQAVLSAEPQMPARGSGALGTLVMRLLRKDPAMRPDAAEIRGTLETVARPPQISYDPTQSHPGVPQSPGTSENRWVPPVLQQSKGARYGLGGGLLAAAIALVLVIANPFGGADDAMPAGWEVRSDREVVAANMAVPSEYKRVEENQGSSIRGSSVVYYDPSGVFQIYLERVETAKVEKELPPSEAAWRDHYEKGGENGTEIDEPKVTVTAAEQQGKKAFDTTVVYLPANAYGDNKPRMRWQERMVTTGEGAAEVYWRLRVSGPADGWAAKEGSELFDRVVRHLSIQEL
ncbi:serine/threonine-protein kinase [Streptomyces albipurpureus]|uniref:non-specific serine/threonine protein kinase n=1 Tax=Streptomyces albipurpureus TaxID=2897419 RepID=A0ABT0ULD0_9ACTN|nr:serine/threonine-protein kinase [Streptomyces sp. CWNU-1]MCM2389419.1 serine/threonine protein kinase [Streptomyces sp. CWNU-1]